MKNLIRRISATVLGAIIIGSALMTSVSVIPTGITEYSITTTGFSSVHKTSSTTAPVYFNFYGRGSTTCVAYGTVGYNMTVNE